MKSLLVYANEDPGLETRLAAALALARLFDGHLTCLQVSPYDAFILGDPFGGVYALPTVIEQVRKTADEHRARIEERLRGEGVAWDWLRVDGAPAHLIVERARLADLIVLSLAGAGGAAEARGAEAPASILPNVLVHARSPVLAVPPSGSGFDGGGRAMVAWDGSLEASHALRLTLPMLARAAAVDIVTVGDAGAESPPADAGRYLACHGLDAALDEVRREGRSVAEALLDAAAARQAAYVVMGAYGHTRLREAVLGGATRDMLHASTLPLLMAH